jgi:hypothetical protein
MNNFAPNSRYLNTATTRLERPDGRIVVYLRRRFVPSPERFALVQYHAVKRGERLDHIAAYYFGDAEQFWRLCDANNALRPEDLTAEVGALLRITLPEGIGGSPYAE